jgi:hypothetical protein
MYDFIEKLLRKANDLDREELTTLCDAVSETLKAYQADKSAANLRNWRAAKEALESSIERLKAKYFKQEPNFPNRYSVFKYLKDNGYEVGKQKIYDDADKGILKVLEDGMITHSEVERYAAYLPKKGRKTAEIEEGTERKLKAEIAQIEERTKTIVFDRETKAGKYVLISKVETEQAVKAAALKAGLIHLFQTRFKECLVMCGGNPRKTQLGINFWAAELDDLFDEFSRIDEIQGDFNNASSKQTERFN